MNNNYISHSNLKKFGLEIFELFLLASFYSRKKSIPFSTPSKTPMSHQVDKGGDSVLVVDIGSSSVKAGLSGENLPACVMPSNLSSTKWPRTVESYEAYSGDSGAGGSNTAAAASDWGVSDSSVTHHPVTRGKITDWDGLEKLWHATLQDLVLSTADPVSTMIVESSKMTTSDRCRWAELLFEKYNVPSIGFGNSSVFCIFAAGRTTGLTVEFGAGITSTVPVYEGLALKHAAVVIDYGGQDISANLKKLLNERNIHIDLAEAKILKERMARVSPIGALSQTNISQAEDSTFFLPDGTEVTVPTKLFSECTQPIFRGSFVYPQNGEEIHPAAVPPAGITSQVVESWTLCDDSVRRELIQNVILAGGSSMLSGLGDRLGKELSSKITQVGTEGGRNSFQPYEARVMPTQAYSEAGYTSQRKFAPWVGASILTSLESYKDLRISRQEWDEGQEASILNKCY